MGERCIACKCANEWIAFGAVENASSGCNEISMAVMRCGKMTVKRIWVSSIPLASLIFLGAAWWEIKRHFNSEEACGVDLARTITAPDGRHEARLLSIACAYGFGSSDLTVTVAVRTVAEGAKEVPIFKTYQFKPLVTWIDSRRLSITINNVSSVSNSLHTIDDVQILYTLAERLSEVRYRSYLDGERTRIIKKWDGMRSEVLSDHERRRRDYFKSLELGDIDRAWQDYVKFKEWAKVNAENGNR